VELVQRQGEAPPVRIQVAGSHLYRAPPAQVWATLMDPAALRTALPGCDYVEHLGDGRYVAQLTVRAGPVRSTYRGGMQVTDPQHPASFLLAVQGAGPGGHLSAVARIRLTPLADGAGTEFAYQGWAALGGSVARLGRPILEAAARTLIGRFLALFDQHVVPPGPVGAPPGAG